MWVIMSLPTARVKCILSGKGIIKRHPVSQLVTHFLNSSDKQTLIHTQTIPQPDHKLLAAPYTVTPPVMLLHAPHNRMWEHSSQHTPGCVSGWVSPRQS